MNFFGVCWNSFVDQAGLILTETRPPPPPVLRIGVFFLWVQPPPTFFGRSDLVIMVNCFNLCLFGNILISLSVFFSVHGCLLAFMAVDRMCACCPYRPEESIRCPRTALKIWCELPDWCWESNPISPEGQPALLAAEASLQPSLPILKDRVLGYGSLGW